jgi:hypothetical protein
MGGTWGGGHQASGVDKGLEGQLAKTWGWADMEGWTWDKEVVARSMGACGYWGRLGHVGMGDGWRMWAWRLAHVGIEDG